MQQWLLQTLADASFSQGRDDEAYKVLQDWSAEFPSSGKPYLMMAAIDALHGRAAAAAANLARHRELLPRSTISYVVLTYPSTDPGFLLQRERLVSGLRKAGLPEGRHEKDNRALGMLFPAVSVTTAHAQTPHAALRRARR